MREVHLIKGALFELLVWSHGVEPHGFILLSIYGVIP